jgi:hypothetical protein
MKMENAEKWEHKYSYREVRSASISGPVDGDAAARAQESCVPSSGTFRGNVNENSSLPRYHFSD